MSLPKPLMRGMLARSMRVKLPLGFAVAFSVVMLYKLAWADRKKRAYAEFYKNYDADKYFNAMRETGVFESVQPVEK